MHLIDRNITFVLSEIPLPKSPKSHILRENFYLFAIRLLTPAHPRYFLFRLELQTQAIVGHSGSDLRHPARPKRLADRRQSAYQAILIWLSLIM